MVVTGIALSGTREILAVEPMNNESEDTYTTLFKQLKARGLKRKCGWWSRMPTKASWLQWPSSFLEQVGKDARFIF
jgi:hypothetical protein